MNQKNILSTSPTHITSKESFKNTLIDVLEIKEENIIPSKLDFLYGFFIGIDTQFQDPNSTIRQNENKKDESIRKISKTPQDFTLDTNTIGNTLQGYKYPWVTFGTSRIPLNPHILREIFSSSMTLEQLFLLTEEESKQLRKADLWRVGCNLAADPGIIIEQSRNSRFEKIDTTPRIAMIIRKDTGRLANPGGMVDSVELGRSGKTAKREAIEEAFGKNSGVNLDQIEWKVLSEGYTSDHRNGFFSGIETSLNYGIAKGILNLKKLRPNPQEVENVLLLSEDDINGKTDFIIIKDEAGKIKNLQKKDTSTYIEFTVDGVNYGFSIHNNIPTLTRINGKFVKVGKALGMIGRKKVPKVTTENGTIHIGDQTFYVLGRPIEKNDFHWQEQGGNGHFDQVQKIFSEYHKDALERATKGVQKSVSHTL